MSQQPKLEYRAGLRKRKMIGTIVEVRTVAGQPVYKIRKRLRHTWVNFKDVVKVYGMEDQTKTTEGGVDSDGGRDQTERVQGSGVVSKEVAQEYFGAGQEVYASEETIFGQLQNAIDEKIKADPELREIPIYFEAESNQKTEQGQGAPTIEIQPPRERVEIGQAMRVRRTHDRSGEPFLPIETAPMRGQSPSEGQSAEDATGRTVLAPGVPSQPHGDSGERSGCETARAIAGEVERPEPMTPVEKMKADTESVRVKKAPNAQTEAQKKRVLREAARTKQISNHAEFIGQLAAQNDARFFIRLAEALKRKKKT